MDHQRSYWDRVAEQKTFTHPLDAAWLDRFVDKRARILDYGCGYGRSLGQLAALGYDKVLGVDFSPRMIERARRQFPRLSFGLAEDGLGAATPESFDLILLLAVLTCIPDDREQMDLVSTLRGLLRPGGLLYISDMPLQTDERNLARYAEGQRRFGVHGVFETDDGAVVRHYDERRFRAWLAGFEMVAVQELPLNTMNGHAVTATQILARRPTA